MDGPLWPKTHRVRYTIAFLLLLVPALWWCIPHSEHTYLQLNEAGLFSWARIEAALHYLTEAIVPVPDFAQSNWWNSHWLENRVDHSLGFAIAKPAATHRFSGAGRNPSGL